MKNEVIKSLKYWNELHENYKIEDIKKDIWLEKFNNIISNVTSPIIDLGCGSGNYTLYLVQKGKNVISCDQSPKAISNIKKNFPDVLDALCFNMLDGLPFEDNYSDLIVADLSLHYFRRKDTLNIINEIKRVLKYDGYLIFRVNSINDINHGAGKGKEIEEHLYSTEDGRLKRFFDEKDIRSLFKNFKIEYLGEETMTRYKLEKKLYEICVRKI